MFGALVSTLHTHNRFCVQKFDKILYDVRPEYCDEAFSLFVDLCKNGKDIDRAAPYRL